MTAKLSDDLIDHVAARMTDAEPSARLRARVLAHLDDAPAARGWSWMPVAATVAAAATLAIAIAWPRPDAAPSLPMLPAVASLAFFAPSHDDAVPVRVRRNPNATHAVSEADAALGVNGIRALDAFTPVTFDGIQPAPLAIPLLVITPLSATATTAGGDGGKL